MSFQVPIQFLREHCTHHYLMDRLFYWPFAADHVAELMGKYSASGMVSTISEDGLTSGVMAFRKRDWDTGFFGYPCASIDHFYVADGERGEYAANNLLAKFNDWAKKESIKFVSIKTYPKPQILTALQNNGFQYIIGEFVLSRALPDAALGQETIPGARRFHGADFGELIRIAGSAAWQARFHLDQRIGKAKGDEFYVAWLKNTMGRENKSITVLEHEGRPAGFIIWSWEKLHRHQKEDLIGDQELVAVDPDLKGRGLGKMLYRATLKHMQDAGITLVKTIISEVNAPALNNQTRLGFNLNYHTAALHKFY